MKIIITGSESFIGKELVAQCLKEDIEVFGFDLEKTSNLPYGFKKGDITDPAIVNIFPEKADAVVHLAALSRNEDCAGKAHECFRVNVLGTLNVMRAARASGARQFIFASSEWVYNEFIGGEEKNEDSLIDITKHTSEYALSKLVSEANLREEYKRGRFMPVTVLRLSIVYGPRPPEEGSALEPVVSDVKNNDTVTLMRSLKSGRRYIHVADIARGIRMAFGRSDFQIINLAADKVVTMGDIITESEILFNKKVEVIESQPGVVNVRNISNKKAKELLGWAPEIDLATGLKTLEPFLVDEYKKKIAKEIIRLRISQMIVNEESKAKRLKVSVHLAFGYESIAVALDEILEKDDNLLLSHRNIAYNLARLGCLRPILDEYFLKPTGLNGGRSGSMNLLNPDKGIIYTSSILGNAFPVANGLAMQCKMAGKKNVIIVIAGDGSMEEGSFYESILMAQSMKLPVIFLVENNEWSLATRVNERRCNIDLALFSKSFNIRYLHLGGNNPYKYIEELRDVRKFSLENNTPACVEVEVAALGGWHFPSSPEFPEGEFVNYHAGPAPEVSLKEWPIIKESDEDPIFVLTKHFSDFVLKEEAHKQFLALQKEIN